MRIPWLSAILFLVVTGIPRAQELPEGPGKEEMLRACKTCHEIERSYSRRQDRAGWEETMGKMTRLGMKISDRDYNAILEYAVKNFPSEELPKLDVNKAPAIEFESRLSLPRSQSAAIVQYRAKNGPFKSIEDLKKVPGVDAAKIEAKKDKLAFQ